MSELKIESLSSQWPLVIVVENDRIRFSTKTVMIEMKTEDWLEVKQWIDWKVDEAEKQNDTNNR